MKIKTSELTGAALDWAVSKAEGHTIHALPALPPYAFLINNAVPFRPSADWLHGGPIIERERIEVRPGEREEGWFGSIHDVYMFMPGTTALIAAMRCYVFYKLGEEVEVPDGLSCNTSPNRVA